MNLTAHRKLKKRDFETFLDSVLGSESRRNDDDGEPELSKARQQIVANFDHDLQRLKGIEHTAWSAFNAVSQYIDWERPTRGSVTTRIDRRFESLMLGAGAHLKRLAWSTALQMSGVR
jgi:hypothetical protein